jgi:rubrerythrin
MEMKPTDEAKLGATQGTELEAAVDQNFRGETSEVGLYLAMSRQAYREGYPEVGEVLARIAQEEAWHAASYAELNGMISESTAENLKRMLAGELSANTSKGEAAHRARAISNEPARDFFDASSRDEARHAQALQGLLRRYFPEG